MIEITASVLCTGLGAFLFRKEKIPHQAPSILGRILYWLGVPLQIFVLTRKSNLSQSIWLPPIMTVAILLLGLGLTYLSLQLLKELAERHLDRQKWWDAEFLKTTLYSQVHLTDDPLVQGRNKAATKLGKIGITKFLGELYPSTAVYTLPNLCLLEGQEESKATVKPSGIGITKFLGELYPSDRSERGSFVLASILGNTGFIGLAIVPAFVDRDYLVWVVLYGVAHNLLGSYGLGVFLASYFGRTTAKNKWRDVWRDILRVPALWAFVASYYSKSWQIFSFIDPFVQAIVWFVVPGAFLLIGMQLSRLRGIQNLQSAIVPSAIKIFVLPAIAGLAMTWMKFPHEGRLALVLMSGMPSAFANAILAEEYNLSRPIAASSIFLSTILLPLIIPLWLSWFR